MGLDKEFLRRYYATVKALLNKGDCIYSSSVLSMTETSNTRGSTVKATVPLSQNINSTLRERLF